MAQADASDAAGYRLSAPAKLNLYLHVTGRRDDGYHLLDSLVVFAAYGDGITVSPADELSLAVSGLYGAALEDTEEGDNLVMRAARLLKLEAGLAHHPGAAISLEKRLPVAAGLGGGSADAAAVLRGLCVLWDISPSDDDLARMAISLGADVPACLGLRPVFVGGIGERLDPAPALPDMYVVLVNPGTPMATRDVFAALGSDHVSTAARYDEAPQDLAAMAALLAARGNDLEKPARELCPAVADVLGALEGGSGNNRDSAGEGRHGVRLGFRGLGHRLH